MHTKCHTCIHAVQSPKVAALKASVRDSSLLGFVPLRAWVVGGLLGGMPPISGELLPHGLCSLLASSERVLPADDVSHVTKAPFYTTGVQRIGHSTVVLLGLAPAHHSEISDLPLCFQQNPLIGGDGPLLTPGRDIRGT